MNPENSNPNIVDDDNYLKFMTREWKFDQVSMFANAVCFATKKHANHKRKNEAKSPYIEHPVRVMKNLVDAGIYDVVTLTVALLHDTVEDTDTTFEEIENNFGKEVLEGVKGVTDDKKLPKETIKRLQVAHVNDENFNKHSALVKLSDKLDNLTDRINDPPQFCSPEENAGYFVWSFFVVRNVMKMNPRLEKKLKEVFLKSPIKIYNEDMTVVKDLDQHLESYYEFLKKQEALKLLKQQEALKFLTEQFKNL